MFVHIEVFVYFQKRNFMLLLRVTTHHMKIPFNLVFTYFCCLKQKTDMTKIVVSNCFIIVKVPLPISQSLFWNLINPDKNLTCSPTVRSYKKCNEFRGHLLYFYLLLHMCLMYLFLLCSVQYVRGLKNFEAEQPYQHAVYYLAVLLAEQAWTKEELLAATDGNLI